MFNLVSGSVCRLYAECVYIIATKFFYVIYPSFFYLFLLFDPFVIPNTTCFSNMSSDILYQKYLLIHDL